MTVAAVGLIAPGSMGAQVAQAITADVPVRWASAGRSAATRERAETAGLVDAGDLSGLVERSELLLSICPPGCAVAVGAEVAQCGFDGIYVDANAVAPATSRQVAATVAPARYVDGGIVGPPPSRPQTTRLYLAGEDAAAVATLFAGGPLEVIVLDGHAAAASALKACYASYTKGGAALLLAIRALAEAEGVDGALAAEWQRKHPQLLQRCDDAARQAAAKGWRFADELREHAAAFADAELPSGFGEAAAEVYGRLAALRDGDEPGLREVVATLLGTADDDPTRLR